MNAGHPAHGPKQDGQGSFQSVRNPDTTWAATMEHPVLYLMSASLVSRAVGIFTSRM
jgi:hypothetical protein